MARRITGAVLERASAPRPYAESRPLSICELTLDDPGPGEVLVRITAAGLCHSDLSVVNNNRPRPLPMLLGHESTGVVEALGEGVDDLSIGDHVVLTFLPMCGECDGCHSGGLTPCEKGSVTNNEGTLLSGERRLHRHEGEVIQHHLGVSGFATYAVAARESMVPIGKDVPPEIAAIFGCAILTGGGAVINELKPSPGDSVAVVGLGGVGMAAVLTAKALGVTDIIGIDAQPSKRDLALEFGCSAAYSPEEAVERKISVNGAVEAAGHPRALETAFAITKPGGTTVTVGLPAPGSQIHLDPLVITAQARRVHGSYLGSSVPSVDIPRYEQLWRDGKLEAEKLISSRIRLDDINEAMDRLDDGLALRQIILFS